MVHLLIHWNHNIAALTANVRQGANGIAFSFHGVNDIFGNSDISLRGNVSSYAGLGTNTLDNSDLSFKLNGDGHNANMNINSESDGSLIITQDDGEFYEGTFEFIAFAVSGNQVIVTDGKFKIKFQ